jgi:cytosine deaminase
MTFDLLVRNANLPDGRGGSDIGVRAGRIAAVERRIGAQAGEVIDAGGRLVAPPFVDVHFHMDATLSLGLPRLNQSGTLLEGIALWGELKPLLTQEAVVERALRYCDLAVAQGLLAIRSHVDVCDDRLLAVDALLEVKRRSRPISTCNSWLSPGRLFPLACRGGQSGARPRQGRRGRGRDPAFRAHHGRRRGFGDGAL